MQQRSTLVGKASVTGPNACWAQSCGNGSAGTNATDSEWIVYPQDMPDLLGPSTQFPPHRTDTFEVNATKIYKKCCWCR